MDILVISGFLGAGKTTFIKELSKKTNTEFAVMENEYGNEGIDGDLLKQNRLKVWELTEGCICCSLKSDFASSILTIANTANPKYLIVEPTGVGMLSSVLANIAKIQYERIKLLQPITIVDVNCIEDYIKSFGEIYCDQIKAASQILLSKIEEASQIQIEKAVTEIKKIKPDAKIISRHYSLQEKSWWNDILNSYLDNFQENKNAEITTPALENISIKNINISSIEELMGKLVTILRGNFGSVFRLKGFAPVNGQWAKFDIVNKEYNIETCDPKSKAKMIVIGIGLREKELKSFFMN